MFLGYRIFKGIRFFLRLIEATLLLRGIVYWLCGTKVKLYRWLYRFTEPILYPFRQIQEKIFSPTLRVDLSFVFCYLALALIEKIAMWLLV